MNRSTDPRSHPGGWQATPGQPIPRAARQPAANGLLLVILLLVWFSPLSILAWLLGQAVILLQRRWHWWRFTLASLAWIGVVLAVTGPEEALRRHIFVPQHFWQYVALHFGFGPPGTRVTVGQFLWDLVATQVWLAVPVGLLAASLSVWNAERAAGGAEWSPFVRRRQRIDQRTRDRKHRPAGRPAPRPQAGRPRPRDRPGRRPGAAGARAATWSHPRSCAARPWPWSAPPAPARPSPCSGSPTWLGVLGRKVCFVDCKGTDPTLVPALIAAYRLGNPSARVGCWPDTAMDMWRGSPGPGGQPPARGRAVHRALLPAGRLRRPPPGPHRPRHAARRGQRRAAAPPGRRRAGRPLGRPPPPAQGHRGHRRPPPRRPAALRRLLRRPGRRLRPRAAGRYEDVDLAVLTVPTLLSKSEADAAMRVVLEDYGHYATGRKPREGEDALLVLDEFSALASGVDSAINLAERVRDVGVQVVVAAQSVEGLGDHRQAPRLLASCAGGIVVHQCPDPERLLALAGMVRTLEHNWELDHYGPRGFAKARMGERPRIDPEAGAPGPARRSLGDPGRPEHPPARAAPAGRGAGSRSSRRPPSRWPTTPSRCQRSRSRPRSGSPPPSPSPPGGASVELGSALAGGGNGLDVCPPRPGGRGWSGGPCQVGGGDEAAGGDRPRLRRRAREPCTRARTGRLPAGRAATWPPPASRALVASLRDRLRRPLTRPSSRRPGETRSPGAGEEQRPTSRQEARTVADQQGTPTPAGTC